MRRLLLLSALALAPSAALAHTGQAFAPADFQHGLLHPLTGPDHLAAMVAVGLWAGLVGGRALFAYPLAFIAAMLAGAGLGIAAVPLPAVEPAILASVILLGLLTAAVARAPLPLACTLIAVFGLAHGHAHGTEAAGGALAYVAGFTIATAALHGAGLLLGRQVANAPGAARILGGAVALAGAALIAG